MKQITKTFFILLSLCFTASLSAQNVQSFTVNGLKVIFKQNTANDIISANMYYRGGVTNLTEDNAGLEALTLVVSTKASINYPKDKLNEALESMNSVISSNSNFDYSQISLLYVKQNFVKSWEIFSDIVVNPSLAEDDLVLEREKMINNVKQVNDDPDAYLQKLVNNQFYVDHPYSVEVNGTVSTLSSFSTDDLSAYHSELMNTSRLLLVVVGNTTKSELEAMVKKSFGNLPVGNYAASHPPAVEFSEPSIKIVKKENPTTYIQGTYSAPARGTEEGYTMLIANSILRDRVFEEVRTKRSLSYAPSTRYVNRFSSYGGIYVTAVDPDTTIEVMVNELQKMKDELIPEKDLKNKIRQFLTFYYLGQETNQTQANSLAVAELSGIGYNEIDNFIEHVNKVSAADIQNVAEKYMKNLQFVLIGNPELLNVNTYMY
ncbi:M16 family metallopeptidase [Bacteroidota bacterium]